MAKGAYVGVDGIAHKVKKIYSGVDNVARKVKKGYVGVGGIARPFFSAEAGLEYYGAIDPLSQTRRTLSATTVGNYALFGGGLSGSSSYKDIVDAYSYNLTRSTPTVLSAARYYLTATTVGNYALFGGGSGSDSSYKDIVDAYVDDVGAEIQAYLAITNGETDYTLIDLVDGTEINIAKDFEDFITLKRGHSYRFTARGSELALGKSIRDIEAEIMTLSGTISYAYNGTIGYNADTVYIAPNISIPDNYGDPEDPVILIIAVHFE